jgi:hypothetical protein
VKKLLMFVIAAALIAPALASARDARPGFRAWAQEQGGRDMKKMQGPPQRGDNDHRGQYYKGQKGRMTEEERRELQRDLERANREIYRRK